MLSNNDIKYINHLCQKKFRDQEGVFIAEGRKIVNDLLSSGMKAKIVFECEEREMKKISQLKTPTDVLGIFWKPEKKELTTLDDTTLLLDTIQDPGNLGTIIRIADWFGINNIICSNDCVDAFSPKVVQATMGAIARVNIYEDDLEKVLQSYRNFPVYGTFLEGENIYRTELKQRSFIIMGNEGKGICKNLQKYVTDKILIPSFPEGERRSESLNVAMATAIVCSEFRSRIR